MPAIDPALATRRPSRTPATWRSTSCRTRANERGAIAAQVAVATPLLILLPMLIVQFVVWAFAMHAAQAAASQGLDATRLQGGTAGGGQAQAQLVLNQLDTGPLVGARVTVARNGRTASVRITGSAESIVPWLHLSVHAHASGPVEAAADLRMTSGGAR